MGAPSPFFEAPLKTKAILTGKPGDRFTDTNFLAENPKAFSIDTGLLADAQLLNDLFVRLRVTPFQVLQMPLAPAHHVEQSTPRSMVLAMGTEVFVEVVNPLAEQRNLNFG
jgi:hypothetical protein